MLAIVSHELVWKDVLSQFLRAFRSVKHDDPKEFYTPDLKCVICGQLDKSVDKFTHRNTYHSGFKALQVDMMKHKPPGTPDEGPWWPTDTTEGLVSRLEFIKKMIQVSQGKYSEIECHVKT